MPQSLSDKLKSLGVQLGAQNIKPRRRMPANDPSHPIESVVEGDNWPTPLGDVFVAESRFDAAYRHGRVGLWPETPLAEVAAWAKDSRISASALETFCFVDTETSGLAGGTGTYAFLVGAGRFEEDTFRLAQFFMRDPTEEPALLHALTEFLEPGRVLVTFNGKSFDGPLLNTRYTLAGQESPLPAMAHLDLLPLARRLWRDRLPSRRLGALEQEILLCERSSEDVPGFLIPQMYFDFLRSGDARPLGGIFYHNQFDVVAMAALLNQMGQMLADPLGEAVEYALDLVAIGKLFEAIDEIEAAAQLLSAGMLRNDLPEESYWQTQQRLSLLEKRRGNWPAAIELWQLAAEGQQIYAHVELAKYYEHRTRDFAAALHWTEAALHLVERPTAPRAERREWLHELKHRQKRLHRKLKRAEAKGDSPLQAE